MSLLGLKYYKEFKEEQVSVLSLVCLVHSIPFNEGNSELEKIDLTNGVKIKRLKSKGNFLSLVKDYELLKSYQNLKVFTDEQEMMIQCPDRVLYHYEDRENYIQDIDIIGQYIYIYDEHAAASGIEIRESETNNQFFRNFCEYTKEDKTSFFYDDYQVFMEYNVETKTFKIFIKNDNGKSDKETLLLEMENISKSISYPFVLYVLKNLERNTQQYFVNTCKVTKIIL